jgi:hypothetical protein
MGDPDRGPGRVVAATGIGVQLEGTLARGDPLRDLAQEPQREPETLTSLGRLTGVEDRFERKPRRSPPGLFQRTLASLELTSDDKLTWVIAKG